MKYQCNSEFISFLTFYNITLNDSIDFTLDQLVDMWAYYRLVTA